jgi:hypothetical protein
MRKAVIIIWGVLILFLFAMCKSDKAESVALLKSDLSFFGDSTAVFCAKELQNGYKVTILHAKQIDLIHFERSDTISRYCAIHKLPSSLQAYEDDSIGVFNVDLEFPVIQLDTIDGSQDVPDMFFMDVNFDGEEDFVVAHEGYNRTYYACFDLVKGNYKGSCPGLLESNNEPPYNNIVSGIYEQPSYTVFDRRKKEIYINETMGCCSYYETWAKYYDGDDYGNDPRIRVVRQEEHEWSDRKEHILIYKLINDSLKLVEKKVIE